MKFGALVKSDFVESEHPRDADGKFTDGGGSAERGKKFLDDVVWSARGSNIFTQAVGNIVAGKPPQHARSMWVGHGGYYFQSDLDKDEKRALSEEARSVAADVRAHQAVVAKEWDAKYPKGKTLYRGLSATEWVRIQEQLKEKNEFEMRPVIATTMSETSAKQFAGPNSYNEYKNETPRDFFDHLGPEPKVTDFTGDAYEEQRAKRDEWQRQRHEIEQRHKTKAYVMEIKGVTGHDVLGAHTLDATKDTYAEEFNGVKRQQEATILGTRHPWKIVGERTEERHFKNLDVSRWRGKKLSGGRTVTYHILQVEPAESEEAEKAMTLGDLVKSEFIESEHPRDADGKFADLATAQAAHEAKYGKRAGFETVECDRCNGKGKIPHYGHVADGECFACNGSGKLQQRIEQPKTIAAREARQEARAKEYRTERLLEEHKAREKDPELYDRIELRAHQAFEHSGNQDTGRAGMAREHLLRGRAEEARRELHMAERRMVEDGVITWDEVTDKARNPKGWPYSEKELASQFVGNVGEKTQAKLKIAKWPPISFDSQFGMRSLVLLEDADGNRLKWWTNPSAADAFHEKLEAEPDADVSFTVKEHEHRDRGMLRETSILRPTIAKPKKTKKLGDLFPSIVKLSDFVESDHPRDADGKWTTVGGAKVGRLKETLYHATDDPNWELSDSKGRGDFGRGLYVSHHKPSSRGTYGKHVHALDFDGELAEFPSDIDLENYMREHHGSYANMREALEREGVDGVTVERGIPDKLSVKISLLFKPTKTTKERKDTEKAGKLGDLVKTATFVETEHPRDEKGRFDFSQHTLMNPPKVQTFRCNRSGCKHWAYNQYGAQSHQDAHTFDDHGGYHREDVADSDWQPSYDGPNIWRSASEPFTGKDGKTWYEIPWTGHEDAKPLGTFIRDELVNEQRRGGDENRYHAAVKTMRALADAVDGKEVAAPGGVEDWNALVEIAKTEHEKAAAEWDEAHPNGGVLYRGISPQAAKAFLESHKEGDTTTLPGTMSTSDDWGQALGFSGEYKDKAGDYMTGGGAILEFLDVRGEDVFQSYRTLPQAFTLPVSEKGDKPQSEHEIQMGGKRPWKIRSIKWEPDGTRNVISLEPATEKSQGRVWDFELFVPKVERMTLGRLIKTVDENGAKHDANGQFSATSGSKKPKKPKAKSPFIGRVYSSFESGPHPATGEKVNFVTANHEWGGHAEDADGTYPDTKRWDTMLVDLGTASLAELSTPEARDAHETRDIVHKFEANKELIRHVRRRTERIIVNLESDYYNGKWFPELNPYQRGKVREQFAAVYYDHNRMFPCLAGSSQATFAAMQNLIRTRDLAKHIATSKPKSLKALRASVEKAYQSGEIHAQLQPGDVEREYLMYQHGVHMSEDLAKEKLVDRNGAYWFAQKFTPNKPTPQNMEEIAIALDLGLGTLTRSENVVCCQHANQVPGSSTLGAAYPYSGVMTVTGSIGSMTSDFCNTVNHEMAHAISRRALKPEMDEFNTWLKTAVQKSFENSPEGRRLLLGEPFLDWSKYLSGHGYRSKDHDDFNFQEDWAIGLSEFVIGLGGKPNMRGHLDEKLVWRKTYDRMPEEAPRRETIEKLAKLFGRSATKPDQLKKIKPFPGSPYEGEYWEGRKKSLDEYWGKYIAEKKLGEGP